MVIPPQAPCTADPIPSLFESYASGHLALIANACAELSARFDTVMEASADTDGRGASPASNSGTAAPPCGGPPEARP